MNFSGQRTWMKIDIIGGCTLVGLTVLAWMFAVQPYQQAVTTRESLEAQLDTELSQAGDLRRSAEAARQAAEVYEARQHASAIQLQPATQFNSRLAALTALAAKFALEVNSIAPGELVVRAHRGDIPIRIEGRGRYPDLAAFLANVHEEHRDTAVRSLLMVADQNTGVPSFTLDLVWAVAHETTQHSAPAQPTSSPKS